MLCAMWKKTKTDNKQKQMKTCQTHISYLQHTTLVEKNIFWKNKWSIYKSSYLVCRLLWSRILEIFISIIGLSDYVICYTSSNSQRDEFRSPPLTSISRLTTPVDRRLGFFFLWMGLSCVGVAAPLPAPSVSPPVHLYSEYFILFLILNILVDNVDSVSRFKSDQSSVCQVGPESPEHTPTPPGGGRGQGDASMIGNRSSRW